MSKKCEHCGANNEDDVIYCEDCGEKIGGEVKDLEEKKASDDEVIDTQTTSTHSNGKSIAGFICAICGLFTLGISSIVGLILSIVGLSESKKRGETDGFALAGIIISAVVIVLTLLVFIISILTVSTVANSVYSSVDTTEDISEENNYSSYDKYDDEDEEDEDITANDNNLVKDNQPTTYQKNALAKAKIYSDTMHMSKKGIYDQLTSEYGEGFTAEEAQYAIDHLIADYKKNALEKAKSYQSTMNMSKSAIYNQLVSEYGEKFTAEEAQYAIDNLE